MKVIVVVIFLIGLLVLLGPGLFVFIGIGIVVCVIVGFIYILGLMGIGTDENKKE